MFKLIKTILKTGDVTTRYPFKPMEVCDGFRGKPQHNANQCIVCAACTMACPANALTMHHVPEKNVRVWQLNVGRCIFCGRCEEVCPTHAIVLSQEFELAVAQKSDFIQRAVFQLQACQQCGEPFAAKREIDYAFDLLCQSGVDQGALESLRQHLETCPSCKRNMSLQSSKNIMLGRHLTEESCINER